MIKNIKKRVFDAINAKFYEDIFNDPDAPILLRLINSIRYRFEYILKYKQNRERILINNKFNSKFGAQIIEIEEELQVIENAKRDTLNAFQIKVNQIISDYITEYNMAKSSSSNESR